MNDDEASMVKMLANLPRSDSDAARSERVRARCHKILARTRPTVVRPERQLRRLQRALEVVTVGGFCVVYLSVVAISAMQTRGLL